MYHEFILCGLKEKKGNTIRKVSSDLNLCLVIQSRPVRKEADQRHMAFFNLSSIHYHRGATSIADRLSFGQPWVYIGAGWNWVCPTWQQLLVSSHRNQSWSCPATKTLPHKYIYFFITSKKPPHISTFRIIIVTRPARLKRCLVVLLWCRPYCYSWIIHSLEDCRLHILHPPPDISKSQKKIKWRNAANCKMCSSVVKF